MHVGLLYRPGPLYRIVDVCDVSDPSTVYAKVFFLTQSEVQSLCDGISEHRYVESHPVPMREQVLDIDISTDQISISCSISRFCCTIKRSDASEILVNSFSYVCLCSASFGMNGACMPYCIIQVRYIMLSTFVWNAPDARKTDLVSYGMLMVLTLSAFSFVLSHSHTIHRSFSMSKCRGLRTSQVVRQHGACWYRGQ
jgi:hypothetical protein